MAQRETPWLTVKRFPARGDYQYTDAMTNYPWVCARTALRLFNIPRGCRIKVVVSDKPVHGAIPGSMSGARYLNLKLKEGDRCRFMTWPAFAWWLGTGRWWCWVEYEEVAA